MMAGGVLDLAAAREAALRVAEHRRRSVIDRGVECNAQLVEQASHGAAMLRGAVIGQGLGLGDDRAARVTFHPVQHNRQGKNRVAVKRRFLLQAGDPLLNRVRHGGLLLLSARKPIHAAPAAHRLSETRK